MSSAKTRKQVDKYRLTGIIIWVWPKNLLSPKPFLLHDWCFRFSVWSWSVSVLPQLWNAQLVMWNKSERRHMISQKEQQNVGVWNKESHWLLFKSETRRTRKIFHQRPSQVLVSQQSPGPLCPMTLVTHNHKKYKPQDSYKIVHCTNTTGCIHIINYTWLYDMNYRC